MAMTAFKIAGKPDLIQFNNIIELHVKIMSIINKINFILSTRERGGAQQPRIAACANVFWRPFWPTCANCQALADRAGRALYQRMHGNWHGFAKNAAKTNLSW
jgi:hypothetical protein